jgi:SagB-type dehydrogenase family enzyme
VLGLTWCTQSRADRADVPSSNTPISSEKGARSPVKLPPPRQTGPVSIEEALARRRSVREFADAALSDAEHSQLLWAAQGITHRTMGLRTAPSAGALYPLEVYLVTKAGVFQYEPRAQQLHQTMSTDRRRPLFKAALEQESVRDAPALFVFVGVYKRTAKKYGPSRAERYVHLEAGHAAQNLLLQAVALDLAAVPIGAFEDERVQQVLDLPSTHRPLYLVPVGRPAR